MNISIKSINEFPDKIVDVLALHKENAKTLGFLPEPVFIDSAENNNILIAVSENETCGYLLFNVNKKGNFIYITHLCVGKKFRKKGISKLLFQELMSNYDSQYRGVRVTCREDYEATNVWEKLGFTFVHEKPGRSKNGSILFIWWFDFNHPDLFTDRSDDIKLKVVLDSNIVYDLMEPEKIKTQNSYALLSDWLAEDVDYYITNQLKNDISHNDCPEVREKSIQFVSQFKLLSSDYNKYFKTEEEVKLIYDKPKLNTREESDIRHITHTINSDATYFLTKDQGIIEHSEDFFNNYSLLVLKPEEFIIQFYSLLNSTDYSPSRLSGSNIQKKRTTINEIRDIPNVFFRDQVEKKKQFENKLNLSLTNINSTPIVIKSKNEKIAFYVVHEHEDSLKISFLRYTPKLKGKTVVSQLIQDFIYLTREKNKKLLIIEENYVSDELESTLVHFSFIKIDNTFYRIVGNCIVNFEDIEDYLINNISNKELSKKYL